MQRNRNFLVHKTSILVFNSRVFSIRCTYERIGTGALAKCAKLETRSMFQHHFCFYITMLLFSICETFPGSVVENHAKHFTNSSLYDMVYMIVENRLVCYYSVAITLHLSCSNQVH